MAEPEPTVDSLIADILKSFEEINASLGRMAEQDKAFTAELEKLTK